ncbi:MAG: cell division ATP-binding protein FtsE [Bacillota bacterium]|jgi:cell division transport system ATP-binding protein
MINMSNVYKSYEKDGNLALNNISLHIDKGDFVFLTGQSGAGKSTLIKLLFREILPDSGQIFVANRSIIRLSTKETVMLRRNTGVVFQDFRLMENKTVFENVAFALKVLEYPWGEIKETVPLVLERLNIAEKADAFPRQLSGGEQQRVALARAIINNPPILLADEPTGNLDPDTSDELMEIFQKINETGTTIIMATHDKRIVNNMYNRVIALRHGEIVGDSRGGWLL